ncbi:MAG: hypoxanthine phosphoribosyltransferase [Chlamydiae bacterium GWC2_50_10]|nr:MAG: hypoxanthine phosphoribosyltransferase [Chlamydiae bacterium GWA2_50_15]OGN54233.1 MAG: hypoxanthine phosphoribosyltransferase [Chlamydiae bacterium GWC2_50_10]OGN55153.1 MAG: hypoxanthine phosphoribosyltransferase [Chlamydiae bacterium GWF2_49_8]OGN58183.1 MAG: hypoxanthine phosphoribosyltransferase [Chlamydiae bacterium RIFCSPHIGHO2_02_FULL_49_29]OGN62431.1 MAG: hypoxanthine phosphoribosyltransferase [Chlamydiae bacterium RIFCSPHIGHO2_12_FULL_49_32]OGN67972.1 MAG: hypoxanthine phosph
MISEEEIIERIEKAALQINEEYAGEPLVVVAVLKGSFLLLADLVKRLRLPLSVEFLKASSYGARGTERGELIVDETRHLDLQGKNVLLIDDIFDSGMTLSTLVQRLQAHAPKTLKTLVLLFKKSPKATSYRPDFSLFEIDDRFVIGYGLDYKERYRELPGIYVADNLNCE